MKYFEKATENVKLIEPIDYKTFGRNLFPFWLFNEEMKGPMIWNTRGSAIHK